MNLKRWAFLLSLIPLMALVSMNGLGAEYHRAWFSALNIDLHFRVDSLSLVFLYLTAIIIPFCIMVDQARGSLLILAVQWLLIAFFTARDLVLFTFFWEAMLIPVYFLINLRGDRAQRDASMRFLIYMIAGSVLMIAGVLAIYVRAGTFDLDKLMGGTYPHWVALTFFLAFAVKTPLIPFHGWLARVYNAAPISGTIVLAALLSKAGIYGFMRIGWELFSYNMRARTPLLLGFAIAGVFYGALAAWKEDNYKKIIAYSSLSHVNFILVGVFVWNLFSREGAVLQAFNHGITITALFMVAWFLQQRIDTTYLGAYGLAKIMPKLAWLTLFFVLASVALPALNNFVGELLILLGLFQYNIWLAVLLTLSIIFAVMYMLRYMQNLYFGPLGRVSGPDITLKEMGMLTPLMALILVLGLYPAPLLQIIGMIK